MTDLFADLQWRGLVFQTTDDAALQPLLDSGGLTAYIGFDPTGDSLHIGSLLQLLNLRRLQLAGHRPIALAGGATGMIGDPSFKSSERSLLDDEALQRNIDGILPQLAKFIDFEPGPTQALLVNNADWTRPMSVIEFLRDIGKHFTVNTMIGREAVRARLEDREQGISFTEFSYALLQANDYVHLHRAYGCSLQMGASDQWGNIVGGVDLIRRVTSEKVYGLCTPLVTKADGTKFGKTESGTIWLDAKKTSPYALYQFFVRTDDRDVGRYLRYFTFFTHEEIEGLEQQTKNKPSARIGAQALAREVVTLVHGDNEAVRAAKAAEALFGEAITELDERLLLDVFAEVPAKTFGRDRLGAFAVVDALVELGLSASKSAARTAIEQGGVAVNNRKMTDIGAALSDEHLLHGRYVVLRRGKREYALARFG